MLLTRCRSVGRPVSCAAFQVTAKEDGNAHFDAFQVSKQCMEMVAEGALEVGEQQRKESASFSPF